MRTPCRRSCCSISAPRRSTKLRPERSRLGSEPSSASTQTRRTSSTHAWSSLPSSLMMRHDGSCSETEILSIGNPAPWFLTAKVEANTVPFLTPFPVRGCNVSLQRILEHVSGVSPRTVMNHLEIRVHEISWTHTKSRGINPEMTREPPKNSFLLCPLAWLRSLSSRCYRRLLARGRPVPGQQEGSGRRRPD